VSSSDQVHWHEGLFLQPHHLQAMQRFLLEQAAAVRGQCSPYPYGVISHELSTEALKNNRVQFDHLHVVMRSGLEVIYPGNAELDPLEIGSSIGGSDGLLIELSVPTWQPDGANVVSDSSNGSGNRFRVREILRPDENTGLNKQPVAVRRLNAKLILAGSDRRGGTETLPVVRVLQGTDGRPTADPQYIPPCMAIGGSSALHMIVSDISDRQQAVRKQLLPKLTRDGFSFGKLQPAQMETWQRFRVAARYGAMLPALVRATGATPFSAYMELAALLGELAAIDPRQPDDFEPPPYEHENLALCFLRAGRAYRPPVRAGREVAGDDRRVQARWYAAHRAAHAGAPEHRHPLLPGVQERGQHRFAGGAGAGQECLQADGQDRSAQGRDLGHQARAGVGDADGCG
jgi:type VI secretion system protein ImpJ